MSDADTDSVSSIERTLDAVNDALERLRAGAYRTCRVCGSRIDDSSLVADPVLATCLAHAEPS